MSKLIFISGVHGVGKSTLCIELNKHINIPSHSCSDIIKANSEYIETSKFIDRAEANQAALITGLAGLRSCSLLLDGHFCLVGKEDNIIELDFKVFDEIAPSLIINVLAEPEVIHRRLMSRDGGAMHLSLIDNLQKQESHNAHRFGASRGIPVFDYQSGSDISMLVEKIR